MNFILRQVLPLGNQEQPIEIHISGDEFPVGRQNIETLTKFPQISRNHAIFYKTEHGELFVKDCKSLNGIFVNDLKIGSSLKRLKIGDIIGFGVEQKLSHEGLVCVLCCDNPTYEVKHELIDLSDDENVTEKTIDHSANAPTHISVPRSLQNTHSSEACGSQFSGKNITETIASKKLKADNFSNFVSGSFALRKECSSIPRKVSTEDDSPNENFVTPTKSSKHICAPNSFHNSGRSNSQVHSAQSSTKNVSDTMASKKLKTDKHVDIISSSFKNTSTVFKSIPRKVSTEDDSPNENFVTPTKSSKHICAPNSFHNSGRSNSQVHSAQSSTKNVSETMASKKLKTDKHLDIMSGSFKNTSTVFKSISRKAVDSTSEAVVTSDTASRHSIKNSIQSCNNSLEMHDVEFSTKKECANISSKALKSNDSSKFQNASTSSENKSFTTSKKSAIDVPVVCSDQTFRPFDKKNKNILIHDTGSNFKIPNSNSSPIFTKTKSENSVTKKSTINTQHFRSTDEISTHNSSFDKKRASVESLDLKKCVVPLTRCDSKNFKFPRDIKNPFLKECKQPSEYNIHNKVKAEKYLCKSNTGDKVFGIRNESSEKKRKISSLNIEKASNAHRSKKFRVNKIESESDSSSENDTINIEKAPNAHRSKKFRVNKIESESDSNSENDTINIEKASNSHRSKKFCVNKIESKSDSNSENDTISYSQVEEIIYLSDEESYLDFKELQNSFKIKEEPIEGENNDMCMEEDESDEIFDSDHGESRNNFHEVQEAGTVESIESIQAFISDNEQKKVKETFSNNVTDECYFPVLSQGFESDEDNSDSDSNCQSFAVCPNAQNSLKEKENFEAKDKNEPQSLSLISKKIDVKSSKVKMIEPLPMHYRPGRLRGRDEGYVEKTRHPVAAEDIKKSRKESLKRLTSADKNNVVTNSSLHSFKIPRRQSNQSSEKSQNKQLSPGESCKNTPDSSKKAPAVKTRPDKFASRSRFLVESVEINPRKVNKTNSLIKSCKKTDIPRTNSFTDPQKLAGLNSNQNKGVQSQNTVQKSFASSVVPNERVVPSEVCNKKINSVNLRDPRLNRIAHATSRETAHNTSSMLSLHDAYLQSNSVNLNNRIHEPLLPSISINPLKLNMIRDIIKLNTKWLVEQTKVKTPPPAVSEGAADLNLSFKSHKLYVSSFYPMLKLEIWEQMFADSKKKQNIFYFSIISCESRDDYIELICESAFDRNCFGLREGCVTILDMHLKDSEERTCYPTFGYVMSHRMQVLKSLNDLKVPDWKNLPNNWKEMNKNPEHCIFSVFIKKGGKTFSLQTLMKGKVLSYLGNKLRLLDALSCMKESLLIDDILIPKWRTFEVNYSKSSPTREYNCCQMEVINGVIAEINKPLKPKIILLQGPPGTGKTHTIIGLLQKMIQSNKFRSSFKVLVAAPSNAAIDEIGCRLIDLSKKTSARDPSIKFVRVGSKDQVHDRMKPFFIDQKANDLYQNSMQSVYNQKEKEKHNLNTEIAQLQQEPYSKDRDERLQYLEESKDKLYSDSSSFRRMDYRTEMSHKTKILSESHVILSTLSSCGLSLLLKTFKPSSGTNFSCCIVDECTQCTELEILQPLVLGISKLVLVGDHKQLPATVTSKLACQCGFERSAFERFHLYFKKYDKKTPMYTLSEQFRMHSSICKFPSWYIYDRKITTHPDTDLKYKDFPLNPFFLLDIVMSQESDDSSSKINSTEASVIVNICSYLIEIVQSSSIGIITPYQAQRSLYESALQKCGVNPLYKDIEVNTVDGFQGREKDIIILSSVRANSQSGSIGFLACKRRLNVAITRARKCLLICAHADSLMNNIDWRELILDAKKRNICVKVNSPKDIPMIFKYHIKKRNNV